MPGRNLPLSFRGPHPAHLEHEQAKAELKSLVPNDAQQAIGQGIRAKRSKLARSASTSSALRAIMQRTSDSIATLAAALAKAQDRAGQSGEVVGCHYPRRAAGPGRADLSLRTVVEWSRHREKNSWPARDCHGADDFH